MCTVHMCYPVLGGSKCQSCLIRHFNTANNLPLPVTNGNKLPINEDKTTATGKRLKSNPNLQPSVKFSDCKLVSNVSSATLLGLDINSQLLVSFNLSANMLIKFVRSFLNIQSKMATNCK